MKKGIQSEQSGRDGLSQRLSAHSVGKRRFWVMSTRMRAWLAVLALGLAFVTAASVALAYYGTDDNLVVGYNPVQPVEFSHKLHAGDLSLHCLYCHTAAERGPMAGIPSTQLCMNCHTQVLPDSIKLLPVRATFAENKPIAWIRVTKLPEFTYFDHSAHLGADVGCSACHGRVELMLRTKQVFSLSMGFCLDCHRNPKAFIHKSSDVTNLASGPGPIVAPKAEIPRSSRNLSPPLHCSGCHR